MFEVIPYHRHNSGTLLPVPDPWSRFDELERSFFGPRNTLHFMTDIKDNGDSFLIEADLPGFKKDDIHIDITGNKLEVKAERRSEDEEGDKNKYIRCERCYGTFSRYFDVTGVDTDRISAEFTDGVLKLTMPKKVKQEPASKSIPIS